MLGIGNIIKKCSTRWEDNKLIAEIETVKNITEYRLQEGLDSFLVKDVICELAEKLAPIIKEKLLEDREFDKILSEVRLEIVKKILN